MYYLNNIFQPVEEVKIQNILLKKPVFSFYEEMHLKENVEQTLITRIKKIVLILICIEYNILPRSSGITVSRRSQLR